jgi:hypothetical protein
MATLRAILIAVAGISAGGCYWGEGATDEPLAVFPPARTALLPIARIDITGARVEQPGLDSNIFVTVRLQVRRQVTGTDVSVARQGLSPGEVDDLRATADAVLDSLAAADRRLVPPSRLREGAAPAEFEVRTRLDFSEETVTTNRIETGGGGFALTHTKTWHGRITATVELRERVGGRVIHSRVGEGTYKSVAGWILPIPFPVFARWETERKAVEAALTDALTELFNAANLPPPIPTVPF